MRPTYMGFPQQTEVFSTSYNDVQSEKETALAALLSFVLGGTLHVVFRQILMLRGEK